VFIPGHCPPLVHCICWHWLDSAVDG